MRSVNWMAPAVAALLAVAACSNDSTGPADGMTTDDAVAVALDTDAMTGQIVFSQILLGGFGLDAGLSIAGADTRTFSRSHDCPAGGTITLEGSIERTRNDQGIADYHATASGAWNDCAHARGDVTRTVNGTFSFDATRHFENGQPVGPQTATKSGHFTWSATNGKSGECDFHITSTRLPDVGKRTVVGTVCGREINREVSWNKSDG